MKGRHQFRRRFSLQPSFLKEEPEDDRHHHNNRGATPQARRCGTTITGEREEIEELLLGREDVGTTIPGEREEIEELLPRREDVALQQQVRGRRERR
uniref:Uncharacterized protein n=1 Tax=Timema monikensis TaxID=170555 RepID=A0A7R9EHZ0_9NEOP|nr:unnamed protein product [Timema monikensis]